MRNKLIAIAAGVSAAAASVLLAAPAANADGQPTLGRVWAPNQEGYGSVRPAKVFNGGDGTGMIWNITWSSWGGAQATGTGTAGYVGPGQSNAEAQSTSATIVAYDLGTCNGKLMYQAAKWYFPGKGESFNPAGHYDICSGGWVDGN